jgi:hypothetical protein
VAWDALFARISQSTSKAPLKLKVNKQQKRKSVNTITDKEKDFLFKAMLADMGITYVKSCNSSYAYFLKSVGFFGRKKVVGRLNQDSEYYEMYGFPYTNNKIISIINERFNTDLKIIFDCDEPRHESLAYPCF